MLLGTRDHALLFRVPQTYDGKLRWMCGDIAHEEIKVLVGATGFSQFGNNFISGHLPGVAFLTTVRVQRIGLPVQHSTVMVILAVGVVASKPNHESVVGRRDGAHR